MSPGEIMTAAANVVLVFALITVFLRYIEVYYRFAKQIKEKQGEPPKRTLITIALSGASLAVLASIITLCIITESIVFLNPEFAIIDIIKLGVWGIVILIIGSASLQSLILSAFLRKIFGKTGSYLETFSLSIKLAMRPLLLDMIWLPVILVLFFHFYPVYIVISDIILRFFISLDLYIPPVVIFVITGAVLGYWFSMCDYGKGSLIVFLLTPLVFVGVTIILDRAFKVDPLGTYMVLLVLLILIPGIVSVLGDTQDEQYNEQYTMRCTTIEVIPGIVSVLGDTQDEQYNEQYTMRCTTIEEIRGMLKYTGLVLVILYLIHRFGTEVLVSAYTSLIELIESISADLARDLYLAYFANQGAIGYAYSLSAFFADWGDILFVIGVIFVIIGVVKKAPVPQSFRIGALKATMVTYPIIFSLAFIAPLEIGVEVLNNLLCMNEVASSSYNLSANCVSAYSVFIGSIVLIFSLYLFNASIIRVYYIIRSILEESRVKQQEVSSS